MTAKTTTQRSGSATLFKTRLVKTRLDATRLSLGVRLARSGGALAMMLLMAIAVMTTMTMTTTVTAAEPSASVSRDPNPSANLDGQNPDGKNLDIELNDNSDGKLDGREAPDFALRTIDDTNLRLSEFRGQVILINFWASWCGACRQAMPAFNDLHEKYQRAGLVMLSINLDDETHRGIRMARSLKIRFPVLLDQRKEVSRLYRVGAMPLTVLIDRGGTVRFVHVGYNAGDQSKFIPPLRKLLNE